MPQPPDTYTLQEYHVLLAGGACWVANILIREQKPVAGL